MKTNYDITSNKSVSGIYRPIGSFVVSAFVVVVGISMSVYYMLDTKAYNKEVQVYEVLNSLLFYVVLGLVSILLVRLFRINRTSLHGRFVEFKNHLSLSFWVIPLLFISMGTWLLSLATVAVVHEPTFHYLLQIADEISSSFRELPFWLKSIDTLVILALGPLVEEYIFRGLLLSAWAVKYGAVRSLLFTSILFALFHLDPLGAFIFGIVMGLIYLKTGSLMLVAFLHFLNNAFAMGLDLFAPGVLYFNNLNQLVNILWFIGPLSAISFIMLWRKFVLWWPEKDQLPPVVARMSPLKSSSA